MPKRKAEALERSKKPARRPPPPPSAEEDEDSDFCEVVEAPKGSPSGARSTSSLQQPTRLGSAVAPRSNAPLPSYPSRGQHLPGNAAVVSMIAGLSGSVPFLQPARAQGMAYSHPRQMCVGGFPSGRPLPFDPSTLLTIHPAFQSGACQPAAPSPCHPEGPSSGGMSSGPVPSHPARVRVREGSAAEEVKEEPDDAALSPTEAEKPSIAVLREHGVPTDDAVQILRRTGHNLQAAIKQSLDMLTNRDNWRREDMARLESEKEKDKVAAERRLNDMTLTVVGDIKPRFQQSLLLDEQEGCAAFLQAIQGLCSAEQTCTPALYAFREKAVNLLFLEQDAYRHFSQNEQVRVYFRDVSRRLEEGVVSQRRGRGCTQVDKAAGEGVVVPSSAQAIIASTSESVNGDKTASSNDRHSRKDQIAEALSACIKHEISDLQRILYLSTTADVPAEFRVKSGQTATLETDGVEEIVDENAASSRSNVKDSRVVICLDEETPN